MLTLIISSALGALFVSASIGKRYYARVCNQGRTVNYSLAACLAAVLSLAAVFGLGVRSYLRVDDSSPTIGLWGCDTIVLMSSFILIGQLCGAICGVLWLSARSRRPNSLQEMGFIFLWSVSGGLANALLGVLFFLYMLPCALAVSATATVRQWTEEFG